MVIWGGHALWLHLLVRRVPRFVLTDIFHGHMGWSCSMTSPSSRACVKVSSVLGQLCQATSKCKMGWMLWQSGEVRRRSDWYCFIWLILDSITLFRCLYCLLCWLNVVDVWCVCVCESIWQADAPKHPQSITEILFIPGPLTVHSCILSCHQNPVHTWFSLYLST